MKLMLLRIPERDIFSIPGRGLKSNEFAKKLDMEIRKKCACIIPKVWTWKLGEMTYVKNPQSHFLERALEE